MPVEQREQVTHVRWSQRATGGTPCPDGRRQPSLGGTSRMNREIHVRICGRLGVKFPGPTRRPAQSRPYELTREYKVFRGYDKQPTSEVMAQINFVPPT